MGKFFISEEKSFFKMSNCSDTKLNGQTTPLICNDSTNIQ